jgi:hypothetical protein
MVKNKAFTERTTLLEENFLSTGSFFQTLGKFNQNASQKESFTKEMKKPFLGKRRFTK